MVRAMQGASVLLLLSVFFAYVLAPAVDGVRRRLRVGRRQRPISRALIIASLYVVMAAAASVLWLSSSGRIRQLVHVSAPAAIDRLFSGREIEAVDAFIAGIPAS